MWRRAYLCTKGCFSAYPWKVSFNKKHVSSKKKKDTSESECVSSQEESTEEVGAQQVDLTRENKKLKDELLRALAEAENVKKRYAQEAHDATKYGTSRLLKEVLSVGDNINRALSLRKEEEKDPLLCAVFEGLALIQSSFDGFLKSQGVEKIEALGATFDPTLHQAVSQVAHQEKKPGTILEVVQTGYKLHDRLLRPALVTVATELQKGEAE